MWFAKRSLILKFTYYLSGEVLIFTKPVDTNSMMMFQIDWFFFFGRDVDYKKASNDEKIKAIPALLKGYQEEVDNLTKRAKFGENAFLNIYQKLYEAPDPVAALSSGTVSKLCLLRCSSICRYCALLNNFSIQETLIGWTSLSFIFVIWTYLKKRSGNFRRKVVFLNITHMVYRLIDGAAKLQYCKIAIINKNMFTGTGYSSGRAGVRESEDEARVGGVSLRGCSSQESTSHC